MKASVSLYTISLLFCLIVQINGQNTSGSTHLSHSSALRENGKHIENGPAAGSQKTNTRSQKGSEVPIKATLTLVDGRVSERGPVLVVLRVENISGADIILSNEFDFELVRRDAGSEMRRRETYVGGVLLKRYLPPTASGAPPQVLEKGATVVVSLDLSQLTWNRKISSAATLANANFFEAVPAGEYALTFRVPTGQQLADGTRTIRDAISNSCTVRIGS